MVWFFFSGATYQTTGPALGRPGSTQAFFLFSLLWRMP